MLIALVLLAAAAGADQAAPDADHVADAATVVTLNRAIQQRNDEIAKHNAAADAAYRRELARYQAAKAANDTAVREATAAQQAYRAAETEHEAAMARWRVAAARAPAPDEARPAAAEPVPVAGAKDDRMVCRSQEVIGTTVTKRVCRTAAQWRTAER